MVTRNYALLQALDRKRMTQGELVRVAGLASETRMSKIVNQFAMPTEDEIRRICQALNCSPKEVDFPELAKTDNSNT